MAHIIQAIIKLFRPNKEGAQATIETSPDFTQLYKPSYTFDEEFYANLCKTIIWTEHVISGIKDSSSINYATVLRQTNPIYHDRPFYDFTCEGSPAPPSVSFNYDYILKEALKARESIEWKGGEFDFKGRILVFDIDITTYDGAPVASSQGFVDEADIPPIDTWFYITKKHLYCWIPMMFIPVMQDAIDVEMFGSYKWLDMNKQIHEEVKHRLTQAL